MIKFNQVIPGLVAKRRGTDNYGSGYYGASRGSRTHVGEDFLVPAGSQVYPLKSGKVTKLGYPYRDDLKYRYVEVTDDKGYRLRYFYVSPEVKLGDQVTEDTIIGIAQNLDDRYKGMPNHVHFEVIEPNGSKSYVNPLEYLEGEA